MCIGIPMVVVEQQGDWALCQRRDGGATASIDMRLIGGQPPGTWVLTFMDAARSVLDAAEAQQVDNALDALEMALRGENVDHLFADLVDREPELPAHLRDLVGRPSGG